MKKVAWAIAVVLGWACAGWAAAVRAAEPAPLTTLRAISDITNAEAVRHQRVSFEATVTYYRSYAKNLFVQDGDSAIFVHPTLVQKLVPGDRIRVQGTMQESFRPYIESADIKVVGRSPLPNPRLPTFEQMIRAETDCRLVTVRAVIQSAVIVPNLPASVSTTEIHLLVDGTDADASIDSDDPTRLKDLLDSEVEITGVQSGVFDNKMQETGILLHVQSLNQVKILKRALSDPWSIVITPMDRIVTGYRVRDLSDRQRVHGTITYYQPGAALILQDGSKSLWITTDILNPLQVGAVADAIGFPKVENGFLTLTHAEVRETSTQAPVTPALFTWRQLALGGNDLRSHVFDLISIEGQVVAQVRQATQDQYVLNSDGHLFSALIRHPGAITQAPLPPIREIPAGTHIRVTGICLPTDANPFNGEVPFDVLMRNVDDIMVVARPPWLNVAHLMLIVGLLLCLVIAIGTRGWIIERRVRRHTTSVAYLEQRRRHILEDINGARPLDEVIEQITELVSCKLQGAPCWFDIAGGARLGNCPSCLSSLRILEMAIRAHSGPPLGTVSAAFDLLNKPNAEQSDALSMGAGLASLAIGTRRLYSELVHRSEFDLLTDIQNRFSMEKHLDTLINETRPGAGMFGIIYIDLDGFKQVNDQYGHDVGDLYLQNAAARMKHQLRPADTLARIGGDEFAVLVPDVQSRADVEEIAQRLDRCFEMPFTAHHHVLQGSASVGIAIYPEDASDKDTLLMKADHAMYVAKNARKVKRQVHCTVPVLELVSKTR
jgi:diguanylate cyclase (GGDEF)-like protein